MKSTRIPSEIEKFKNDAGSWWDRHSHMENLYRMNRLRVPYAESTLSRSEPCRKKVLDVGAGCGYFSEGLAESLFDAGWRENEVEIIGLEPTQEGVKAARNHLPPHLKGMVTYVCDTIENFIQTHATESFDTVIMSEVIDHVGHQEQFVEHAAALTKPGGSIIITTPAKTYLSWLVNIILCEYVFGILPVGSHHYDLFIGEDQVDLFLRKHNCRIVGKYGMQYLPIIRRWVWFPSRSLYYAIHAIKL